MTPKEQFEASIKELPTEMQEMARVMQKAFEHNKAGLVNEEQLTAQFTQFKADLEKITATKEQLEALEGMVMTLGTSYKQYIATQKSVTKLADNIYTEFVKNESAIKELFNNPQQGKQVVIKAAHTHTTANTPDASALDGSELQSYRVDAFVPARYDSQFIFDIADRMTVQNVPEYIIWEEEGDAEGAIALVNEGVVKPLTSYTLVENKSKYKKAAGKMVITTEFEKFRKRQYQIIRTLFNDKVLRDYQNILTADLLANASSYVGTILDGTYANPTDYHAMGAVSAQLESLNFAPDTLVINPQDKWRIALDTDANGQFLIATLPLIGANGNVKFMNFRTYTSNKLNPGEAIICEGRNWKIEDEAVTLRVGYGIDVTTSNGAVTAVSSDLDNNRMRIIGELFFHSYVPSIYAGSIVKFEFDAVKQALLD